MRRLFRVRMTVRGLMVLVAVVGLVLGIALGLRKRAGDLKRLGDYHMSQWAFYQNGLANNPSSLGHLPPSAAAKRAAWHESLWRKYEKASGRPWLPVSADPPKPVD